MLCHHIINIKIINDNLHSFSHTNSSKTDIYFIFIAHFNLDTKFLSETFDLYFDFIKFKIQKSSFTHPRLSKCT